MKDKWDKLTNLVDEYECVEGLDKKVIEQIKESQEQKTKKKFSWKAFSFSAVAVILAVAIALPIYFSLKNKKPEVRYYDDANIIVTETMELANELAQNNVIVKCLELINSIDQIARTVETNEFAYFVQKGIYINSADFDSVELRVAVLKNAEFDFEQNYVDLLTELDVNEIKVVYKYLNKSLSNIIKMRFEYNGCKYYLEITTSNDVEETVAFYVSLLTT